MSVKPPHDLIQGAIEDAFVDAYKNLFSILRMNLIAGDSNAAYEYEMGLKALMDAREIAMRGNKT